MKSQESISSMQRLINPILSGEGGRECITNLLKGMCDKLDVDGCILWRATTDSTEASGWFTMLASWFADGKTSFPKIRTLRYSGKIEQGHAGKEPGTAWPDNDFLRQKQRLYAQDPFFHKHGLQHAMVMRFNFARSNRFGVITVYRKEGRPFTEDDLAQLRELKDLLPDLYRIARDRTGFKLICKIAEIFRKQQKEHSQVRGKKKDLKDQKLTEALKLEEKIERETVALVGAEVGKTFSALETSIFLDSEYDPGSYQCAWVSEETKKVVDVTLQTYRASPKKPNGFSGLVLLTEDPVHIYDTQDPARDVEECRKRVPEFEGHSGHAKNAAAQANAYMEVDPELPPPHSLVIAPIQDGSRILGFLRCWIARENPHYYSQDDEDLLRLVALDLGRLLGEWREERVSRTRAEMVQKLTEREGWNSAKYLHNPTAHAHTDSLTRDVLQVILELVDFLVPGSDVNSVRLLDRNSDEFYFFLYPPIHKLIPGKTVKNLQEMRFPVSGTSLAAKICRDSDHEPRAFYNLDSAPVPGYTELFVGVRHIIIAPIEVDGEVEGVLDIRSLSDALLEPAALEWTKVIVFMMSLLIGSQRAKAAKRDADIKSAIQSAEQQRKEAEAQKRMRDAFEDLAHQMKSPLAEAQNRIAAWLDRHPFMVGKGDVNIFRSLIDRAQHTTYLINLFATFAADKKSYISRSSISPLVIAQVVSEVCTNAVPRIHPHRNIQIHYDAEKITKHAPMEQRMERKLLTEALTNLVDNAVKYSFSNTVIQVTAGRTGTGRFYICVRNKGIRVKPQDIPHMTQRGWRGKEAELAVGEGSGLGLYIVDMIMKLHSYWLDILPTSDTTGYTEVRLIFPNETEL